MIARSTAATLALSLFASACRPPSLTTTPTPVRVARATPVHTADVQPRDASAPERAARRDAPLFYGVINGLEVDPRTRAASFVAGNLRVEMSADGSVRAADEAPPTTVRWRWSLGGARTAFVTVDEQVLVSDTFTGPFVTHVALDATIIRHATGAVPAVRTSDGAWHRIDRDRAVELESLAEGTIELHFADASRAYAIAEPGVVFTSENAGQTWTRVPLDGDVALRFDRTVDGQTVVRGARAMYAFNGATLRPTPTQERAPLTVSDAERERVNEQWGRYWRANLWPAGATWFWLVHEGRQRVAIEHHGALAWWGAGSIHRMNRDGSIRSVAVEDARHCKLMPFGANVLAYCKGSSDEPRGKVIELELSTLSAHTLVDALNDTVTVQASSDGGAIAFGHVPGGMNGPDSRLWTRRDPTLRPIRGTFPNAVAMVEGRSLLVLDQVGLQLRDLGGDVTRGEYVRLAQASSGRMPTANVLAMSPRADGGYAVVRRRERGGGCEVVLGSALVPSVRAALPECVAPSGVAFVDERFGAVVDLLKTWVTTDGGAHWSVIPRSMGVVDEQVRQVLDQLPPPRANGPSLVIAPYRRIDATDALRESRWARAPYARTDLRSNDDEEPLAEQPCDPSPNGRTIAPSATSRDQRSIVLVHQRTRAEVLLTRSTSAVTVRWSGDETGAGSFDGPAPWREPAADFERGATVGYALRGVSRAGVLIERCLLGAQSSAAQEATDCDVRWLTRDHRAVAMDLQGNGTHTHGAWVVRAAPDELGWVVELGSAQQRTLFEWKQWQHWRANGTIERWGDVVRDWQTLEHISLARINARWGVMTDAGFVAHGSTTYEAIEAPSEVGFCAERIQANSDIWHSSDDWPEAVPSVEGGHAINVLRRTGADWCIERAHDAPWWFSWTTVEERRPSRGWALVANRTRAGGAGALRMTNARGAVDQRALRCEPIAPPEDEEPF